MEIHVSKLGQFWEQKVAIATQKSSLQVDRAAKLHCVAKGAYLIHELFNFTNKNS